MKGDNRNTYANFITRDVNSSLGTQTLAQGVTNAINRHESEITYKQRKRIRG